MKCILTATALVALVSLSPVLAADTRTQSTQVGKPHMEFDCGVKGKLRLFVRPGEIHIVGSEDGKMSVDLSGRNVDKIEDVKAHWTCSEGVAELHVTGGPRSELIIAIHVPRNMELYARIPAGQVNVEGIPGNKDVEIHAGELNIDVVNAKDYGHVDASVYAGEVDAEVFGGNKGGLFRTFSKDATGPYHLHAHVGSGQLTLR
jgi:hypothetical protein